MKRKFFFIVKKGFKSENGVIGASGLKKGLKMALFPDLNVKTLESEKTLKYLIEIKSSTVTVSKL